MFDSGLRASVGRVAWCEGTEERGDYGDDFAVISDVLATFAEEVVGGLGVDVQHHIQLLVGCLDNRLLQYHSDDVHRQINLAHSSLGIGE